MSTIINVPFKVRRGGTIRVKESRETIQRRISEAKRRGTMVTLTEVLDEGLPPKVFDIKPGLINTVEP